MTELSTGFKRVARSGPTIDGRTIKAEWLLQIADSYNPNDYTANIFPDHWYWSYNYGQVLAVKAEKDKDGVVTLYADMKPNEYWRADVKNGQRLYTSITVSENPLKPGTMYLSSLAATDNPASLGVDKLEFSKKNKDQFFSVPVELDGNDFFKLKAEPTDEIPNWFKNLFKRKPQDELMKPEERTEIDEKFSGLSKKIDDAIAQFSVKNTNDQTTLNPEQQGEFSTLKKEVADLKAENADLKAKNEGFSKQFADLSKEFADYKTKVDDALKETQGSDGNYKKFGADVLDSKVINGIHSDWV